ncbi:MAG: hypothetical protein EOM19_01630 [Candidatus Moranbacteria bacterium]|nr:hypothetical protein [Candidatus Moranbacteria bacterium]
METLFRYIEKIRSKPEHIRLRYVFLCVLFVMSIVIFVWVFSLYHFFGDIFQSSQVQETQENVTSWKGEFEEYLKDDNLEDEN